MSVVGSERKRRASEEIKVETLSVVGGERKRRASEEK